MCANATPTSTSSSPGRSLLSRLTSPLRSRTRNLTDFQIRLDEPHRKYSPGDTIKGAVILTATRPIGITHLTVCLHGFVRVFKNPNAAKEPFVDPGLTASNNPRKSQYFGNGHASLFQDEVLLCGKGRLDIGVYEFNFDLEFPAKGLPTSIDFERGTISYLITATITRPTSITPTTSCDTKVSLVESIDIGPMLPPRPRPISLEPISRKSRRIRTFRNKEGSKDGKKESIKERNKDGGPQNAIETIAGDEPARMTSPLPDDSASQYDSTDHNIVPRSPVPSEPQSTDSVGNSNDSSISSSTGTSYRVATIPSSTKVTQGSHDSNGSKTSLADQTITATIELAKSGCLPGDNLPLKISIKHTKPIRSMHGIIITFYRQGRIDSAPPLSLFADIKGKEAERLKHDEYYPKSKTGLGGLSLTSAGSSSMFRKDLAQTFAPLIVDPTTLTTVVQASVRVPEDVFPTIQGVPGQMISFKYYIEVVVDLGGKLAGQQRHVPRVGAVSSPPNYLNSASPRGDSNPNILATWGGSIVGTENIRREKSVVACYFEVVVGTKDSTRIRTRGVDSAINEPVHKKTSTQNATEYNHTDEQHPYPYHDHEQQYQEYYPIDGYDYQGSYPNYSQDHYTQPAYASIPIPPPEIQASEGLSEKELARRAEERLLPSQPPEVAGPSNVVPAPSAPGTEAEEDLYSPDDATPQATNLPSHNVESLDAPSAPGLNDLNPVASLSNPTDDKLELERQRLMAEASGPSFPSEADEDGGEGSGTQLEPSAPILSDDDDDYGGQHSHHIIGQSSHRDALPKYEQ